MVDESSKLVVTDVAIDDGAGDGLGFKDFEPSGAGGAYGGSDIEDDQGLLAEEGKGGGDHDDGSNASICSIKYYRQFFNVTSADITSRLLRTLDVRPEAPLFYIDDAKPDMYGPFWICTTLVFLMAATGNVAHYLETSKKTKWKYDFEKITTAAWIFYSSISIIPIAVWFALGHLNHAKSLVEVISIYGYSLFVFIPTCIICVAPIEWLRWTSIILSFMMSSIFIVRNLGNLVIIRNPERNRSTKTKGYVLLGVILFCHATIALLMKIYFFDYD
mmetsp:Transcript_14467/g.35266  ORF Transcript_14467/g.35266 Transcript_14467/m.35266 type:complete len:274 (-) Transcript_14467:400-1221(-)|eukprot:CAMPEP_0114525862 /NCGR_PEP_ID=MMETSP0109-20121206/22673_1 /TAXON_ID=29199 /ORGANISM="Chlorarachnion reptans, Strain CCCM449" /LENGTH=273 /DNA_ID=CAMNT_0001707517 /DNA_START=89 /DNA_END=910 /DNA_ORIENTATION=+